MSFLIVISPFDTFDFCFDVFDVFVFDVLEVSALTCFFPKSDL